MADLPAEWIEDGGEVAMFGLRTCLRLGLLILASEGLSWSAFCRLNVVAYNRARFVPGWAYLTQECGWNEPPFCLHTVPFGNWGVDSNYGSRNDGQQFQGWYPRWAPTTEDLEWNSCTADYPPPNCDYYTDCYDQSTRGGEKAYGSAYVDIWVECPQDTNGDGDCDMGGCKDVWQYGESNNWMAVYEIDLPVPPWCGGDDYVDTLYFPATQVSLICEPGFCEPARTGWFPRTSSSFAYAEMSMAVNGGSYVDDERCQELRYYNRQYNCLW